MKRQVLIPETIIISKILHLRNKKVMIDRDLATLYGVETKRLNEAVKRNSFRFPEDFMFQLTKQEKDEVVAICDHLGPLKFSKTLPFAFTEHGAVMLASVINSETAIAMNIQIVRVFMQMREMALTHKDILVKLMKVEQKITAHDADLKLLFEAVGKMLDEPQTERVRIGYKTKDIK
ncbi:MAG: ORF6N domain-containing protein [Chitinophagales bacterium]|nr:ORF6N domain-containing protein [Chitinophagales bacterium]